MVEGEGGEAKDIVWAFDPAYRLDVFPGQECSGIDRTNMFEGIDFASEWSVLIDKIFGNEHVLIIAPRILLFT